MTIEDPDVCEFLAQVDPLKKGNYAYYSRQKKELSYLCGLDAWKEACRPEVFEAAEAELVKILEV